MVRSILHRWTLVAGMAAVALMVAPGLAQAKRSDSAAPTIVCKHGCEFSTIQAAVNHTGQKATVVVRPGKYVEGVIVSGHKHDGLTIEGSGSKPDAVLLEGKNAKVQTGGSTGSAQNGIEGDNVNNLTIEDMKAENYPANGFFINHCDGYLMKNLVAGFEHSYGMYVFRCVGGRMTQSVGYGNGDSAFYVGGTPFEKHPVTTTLDHDTAYENVLGYSGTNSKYMVIRDSKFYNNGVGVAPNTLQSEPDQPADTGIIEHNEIFWNNFDYYRPGSPVHTVSSGVSGSDTGNYPIGVGVVLFGTTNWTVKNNDIFGNFLWGVSSFSNPLAQPIKKKGQPTIPNGAINNRNHVLDNVMGAAGSDTNGRDFFNDGSGSGTCYAGNKGDLTYEMAGSGKFINYPTYLPAAFSSFKGQITPDKTVAYMYPTCPTLNGSGAAIGDIPQDLGILGAVSLIPKPVDQDTFWTVHSHPARAGLTPYTGPPAKLPQQG
jgi:hypothetical protein